MFLLSIKLDQMGILEKTGTGTRTGTDGQFFADSYGKDGSKAFKSEIFGRETSGVASAISEGDILIYSCSAQLISFEIESTNMSPSLATLLRETHSVHNLYSTFNTSYRTYLLRIEIICRQFFSQVPL